MMSEPSTPLYTALTAFAQERPLRMAMPGHKGAPLPGLGEAYAAIDFTELPPTGNLYAPGGAIEQAERLWAERWGADACLFLTGGSTQGIHAALLCATKPGDTVLMDRVSHRSLHTGMALLDLKPVWLEREWQPEGGIVGSADPEKVEEALRKYPNLSAVCITSPTYYGVLSDVPKIAEICHFHQVKLVVDAAHGAHLPLLGENPFAGADFVITSAHKTLRAPGQSALLFAQAPATLDDLREASMTFATSSPSYPMMAALDCCRAWYAGEGTAQYQRTAAAVAALRRDYPSLHDGDAPLDPCRFVLCVEDGFAVEKALHSVGIYPEMADACHVVFILTDGDQPAHIERLRVALDNLGLWRVDRAAGVMPPLPPLPEPVLSPREAAFGQKREIPFAQSAGHIAAQQLAPYPPGVPVVAPGERIDKKVLSYLKQIGYNTQSVKCVVQD